MNNTAPPKATAPTKSPTPTHKVGRMTVDDGCGFDWFDHPQGWRINAGWIEGAGGWRVVVCPHAGDLLGEQGLGYAPRLRQVFPAFEEAAIAAEQVGEELAERVEAGNGWDEHCEILWNDPVELRARADRSEARGRTISHPGREATPANDHPEKPAPDPNPTLPHPPEHRRAKTYTHPLPPPTTNTPPPRPAPTTPRADNRNPTAPPTPKLEEAPRPPSLPSREATPANDHPEKPAPDPNPTRAHPLAQITPPGHRWEYTGPLQPTTNHTRLTSTTPQHKSAPSPASRPSREATPANDHPEKPAPPQNPTRRHPPECRQAKEFMHALPQPTPYTAPHHQEPNQPAAHPKIRTTPTTTPNLNHLVLRQTKKHAHPLPQPTQHTGPRLARVRRAGVIPVLRRRGVR